MSAHKTRSDPQIRRSRQAGSIGLKSKKRVRFQTDEQQAETNEEEDDRSKRPAVGGRAIVEAVAEEQREHEDGIKRESKNTGGCSGSDDQRAAGPVEEELEEGRTPNALAVPEGPSKQEREEHNLTHIPFRDWCEHCVRARARRRAHRRRKKELKKEELQRVTRIYMDFYYNGIGEEEEEKEEA